MGLEDLFSTGFLIQQEILALFKGYPHIMLDFFLYPNPNLITIFVRPSLNTETEFWYNIWRAGSRLISYAPQVGM